MKKELNGINESGVDKLILDISNSADRINEILNKISELINDTSNYFNCENAIIFRQNFNNLKINFPIVSKNILQYTADLVKVKVNYNNRKDIIIQKINDNVTDGKIFERR